MVTISQLPRTSEAPSGTERQSQREAITMLAAC